MWYIYSWDFDNEEFLLKLLKSILERKGIIYEADNVISVKKKKKRKRV